MKLEELLESLDKAAEVKAPAATADDKPQVSKELDALLTKEAAETNARQAFEDGEKLAHSILETLATQAVSEATKQAETKTDATSKVEEKPAVEKVAEEKKAEVKAAPATATKEVEKKAETKVETKEETMNKQATDAGKELAAAILEKLAAAQGPSSENSGPSGAVHKIQQDHAKDVSQDDAKVGPTPGRNGTFNQLFDAIVAKAKAVSNATGYDQVATGPAAGHEAKDQALGTPAIPPSPDINDHAKIAEEKQEAVSLLIKAGASWEQAVELVKQASEEIEAEEMTQIKIAAVNELMESGVDFDIAVDSVRTAVQEVTAPEGKQ